MTTPSTFRPLHPYTAPPLTRLVQEIEGAVRAGDLARAVEMAKSGLARGYEHPLLLNLRAYWYEQQNRNNEAIWDLERAAAISPRDVLIRNALGEAFTRVEHWPEAIAEFGAAIAIQPDFIPAHINLASARETVGDLDTAWRIFEHAASLEPNNMEIVARLAALAARRARWDQAGELASRALTSNPQEVLAKITLANIAMQRNEQDAEAIIAEILSAPETPDFYRAMTLSLLGDLRHTQSRFDEAFSVYEQGNALRRHIFASRYTAPGVRSATAYADWLMAQYVHAPMEKWVVAAARVNATSSPAAQHVFQIGFPRSGTTLLENVLSSNPDVVTLEEKESLVDAVRAFLIRDDGRGKLENADNATLNDYRHRYWKRVAEHREVRGHILVDKQPLTSMKLPVIAKLFPAAKILFSVRDPRDVVLSCFRRQFTLNPSMFEFLNIVDASKFYSAVMHLAMMYREKFRQPWHEVRYEQLVEDFENEAKAACAFIGANWNDAMHDFAEHARERVIATPSASQVRRGLNRSGIGQWRHYRAQLVPALSILQPWIERFGYPAD